MYEVLIESSAERDLKRLPKIILDRIISDCKALKENPRPAGSRKITDSRHDWRIRVGEYRIIYEIVDREKLVRIMYIKHRKDVYRK